MHGDMDRMVKGALVVGWIMCFFTTRCRCNGNHYSSSNPATKQADIEKVVDECGLDRCMTSLV